MQRADSNLCRPRSFLGWSRRTRLFTSFKLQMGDKIGGMLLRQLLMGLDSVVDIHLYICFGP